MSAASPPRTRFAPLGAARTIGDGLASWPGLRWLLWLIVATWFLAPALSHPYAIGPTQDWQYFTQHTLSAWRSWFRYGQLPIWEPYYCGGMTAIGNLQNSALSLSTLLTGLFGPWPGQKLSYLLFFAVGMEGTYRYARQRGVRGIGALVSALTFALSGRFVRLFEDGQPIFLAFHLTPWALLYLERGLRSWKAATAGGVVMTLCLLEGGAIPTPTIAVLLGLMTVLLTLQALLDRDPKLPWYRPALTLAWMTVVTLGLGAFRVLPVAEEILSHPRVWHGVDIYSIGHVVNMLLFSHGQLHYFGDGSSFVGHIAIVLFALGVVAGDRRSTLPLVASVLLLDLSTGGDEFIGLFVWLKQLPVLENLRNPFRFTIFIALFVSIGAGIGISLLEHNLLELRERLWPPNSGAKRIRIAVGAASLLGLLALSSVSIYDLTLFTRARVATVFTVPAPLMMERPFRQSIGNRWAAGAWPAANLGTLQCFEEQPFSTSAALRGDLPQEAYLALPDAGKVHQLSWSPRRIELAVDLSEPATLLVNQNAHRGWRTDTGEIVSHQGLLAIRLPAGSHRVVLRFEDPLFELGLSLSGLMIATLVALWIWSRRRRRRQEEGLYLASSQPTPPERIVPS